MKILILTFEEWEEKLFSQRFRENIIICSPDKKNSSPLFLKKYAKSAESQGCEMLLDATEESNIQHIEHLLDELKDLTAPTEIITSASNNSDNKEPGISGALLMLQLLTGENIPGFRCSLRLYPIKLLLSIKDDLFSDDLFYTAVLIDGGRAGYKIRNITLDNYTPEPLKVIPSTGFFIYELFKSLRPWPYKRLCERNYRHEKFMEFLLHPLKFLKFLIMENATPGGLAAASAVGMFIGTLPLLGIHTAAIIYFSIKLRLNKMLSVNISHLCMPPFVPFACIETGYYIRNREWLSIDAFKLNELHLRIFDWIIGSLFLAPLNAVVFAAITYFIALSVRRFRNE